jgi:6-phospho-beta-glucosidase
MACGGSSGADVGGPAIAVCGGGVYVSRLAALCARALPAGGTLRLWARRAERLATIAAHAATRVARGWRVRAAARLDEALVGADAVVLLVRAGGLEARHHDETFPARFGLAGDEGLGPGGFANGWRTVPLLAGIAEVARRSCPSATVWNLVAPLGITTRLLLDEGLRAVGVCELPLVTREALGGGPCSYVGLNHLGWFWGLAGLAGAAGVDGPTLARFGAAPLRYYYEVFDREAGARLGIVRRPGRARQLAALAEAAVAAHARDAAAEVPELAARPTPWFDRALVPMMAAAFGGASHEGFASVANRGGLVAELPEAAVVEVPARCGVTVEPRRVAGIPPAVRAFLAGAARAEDLAYRAARARDPRLLRDALAALPLAIDPRALPALVAEAISPLRPEDRPSRSRP